MSSSQDGEQETILSEVIAASLGGAISASILYPLEVLKTKMQAQQKTQQQQQQQTIDNGNEDNEDNSNKNKTKQQQQPGMISYAKEIYEKEGSIVFVRGIETSAFQSALEKALYFFAYTSLKDCYYYFTNNTNMNTITNLTLGCISEWAHLPITLPVDAWTTRIQTTKNNNTTTPIKILLNMLSDKNTNFYKGISAYYVLCFKPALQYTIYEQVKKIVLLNRRNYQKQNNTTSSNNIHSLSSMEAFILGMIARTISTVLVFPFIRAKVLLQAQQQQQKQQQQEASETTSASTTTGILWEEYNQVGIMGLYQGITPELTRGVFSAALMLMIKERIAELVRILLLPKK